MASVKLLLFLPAVFLVWALAASSAEPPRRIEIIAKRFTYDPNLITLKKGQSVVLAMHSIDVAHGLKVEEFNIKSDEIKKGKETQIQFTPNEAGHYVGQCAHFCGKGHGSMKLHIDVIP